MGSLALIALAAVQISVQARAVEPGELAVLTIALPEHRDAVRVRAFDRDAAAFAVDDRRWRALVGIDLDVKPGAYLVTVEAGAGLMATKKTIQFGALNIAREQPVGVAQDLDRRVQSIIKGQNLRKAEELLEDEAFVQQVAEKHGLKKGTTGDDTELSGAHKSKPEYNTFKSSSVAIDTPELPTLP